jgi:rhodanese-related sulfurtransferase
MNTKTPFPVIPAKAGIQKYRSLLDPGLRRGDGSDPNPGLLPVILRETIFILILSLCAGLGFNLLRPERLPLVADWTIEGRLKARFGEKAVISLEEAKQVFFSKKAVFLDARPPRDYREGHIQGARNLPIEAFDKHFDKATRDLPQESLIITYCDGETCTESNNLTKMLKDMGYENVRILVNGWSLWRNHHLPLDGG